MYWNVLLNCLDFNCWDNLQRCFSILVMLAWAGSEYRDLFGNIPKDSASTKKKFYALIDLLQQMKFAYSWMYWGTCSDVTTHVQSNYCWWWKDTDPLIIILLFLSAVFLSVRGWSRLSKTSFSFTLNKAMKVLTPRILR